MDFTILQFYLHPSSRSESSDSEELRIACLGRTLALGASLVFGFAALLAMTSFDLPLTRKREEGGGGGRAGFDIKTMVPF